jgi:hypothetical protein
MHSTLNALAMIVFTRPYREAVKKWLLKRRIIKMIMMQYGGNSVSPMVAVLEEMQPANVQIATPADSAFAKARKKSVTSRKVLTKIT